MVAVEAVQVGSCGRDGVETVQGEMVRCDEVEASHVAGCQLAVDRRHAATPGDRGSCLAAWISAMPDCLSPAALFRSVAHQANPLALALPAPHSAGGLQTILKVAAGNGVGKVVVGKDAIMATPAMSALIRR